MQIEIKDNNGNVLEIANGSGVYFKNGSTGKDIHMEWHEFNEEGKARLGGVVNQACQSVEEVGEWLDGLITFFEEAIVFEA